MKKILFFIPTLGGGGAEKVLVNLVNNMDTSKFDITVLTLFDSGNNKKNLLPHIKYEYVFKSLFKGNIHLFKLFTPNFLAKKFIKEEYDIAVSYLEGPTTRIISGINNKNTKKISWIHSNSTKSEFESSYRNFNELVKSYKAYDTTVFVSETAMESFIQETGLTDGNHTVMYNTVETSKIIEASNEIIHDVVFDSKSINLITVGRLIEVKGYDRLLKVIKKLVEEKWSIHLYILGVGGLANNIKMYIEKNQLQNHITLLGYKENPYKYVKQADIFVCASYSEGFSTAVTESIIVGTPVVTTEVSGMEEMLGKDSEYGLIVNNDTESLYNGIKALLNNESLLKYYNKKVIERSSFFDTEKTVKNVESLFKYII
ncbi:glycosyltransferase [Aerococcus urinaeequi]|uniref:glycosyltransferase n=1 Tax=Aerococcus urinaeequi TaxID=51665 RepID=UPI003EDA1928